MPSVTTTAATPTGPRATDKAIADYTEAIRLNPKDAAAHCDRGRAYADKGDLDKANADYTEAIRLDPDYKRRLPLRIATGRMPTGLARIRQNDCQLQRGHSARPRICRCLLLPGFGPLPQGRARQGYCRLSEAVWLDPKHAKAYCNRGGVYYVKGEHDKAIADFTEAARLDPQFAKAYYGRAVVYEKKNDKAKAEEDLLRPRSSGTRKSRQMIGKPLRPLIALVLGGIAAVV